MAVSEPLDLARLSDLLSIWREDYATNKKQLTNAGFQALAVYRLGVWAGHQKGVPGRVARILYRILNVFVRSMYSIELPRRAVLGRRLWIPHSAGIVISQVAEVGDDCLIRQNVTIGSVVRRSMWHAPTLGNRVEIGAGAVIVGDIDIGDGARIGPNAVVMTDVPPGASAFAAPARVMKTLSTKDVGKETPAAEI